MIFSCTPIQRIGESSPSRSGVVLSNEASPRPRNIMASVAMNGCTLKYLIRMPDTRPNAPPAPIITAMTA